MWLYYLIAGLTGYFLASLMEKREKIHNLHQHISQYHGPFKSVYHTLVTIIKMRYDEFHKFYIRALKQARHITKDVYEVDYYHENRRYRIRFRVKSGNIDTTQSLDVSNENNDNITEMFHEYLGPNRDFHGQVYTPSDLGHARIRVLDDSFQSQIFEKETVLRL